MLSVKRLIPGALLPVTLFFLAGAAFGQTADLFFSEYIEGSSNNKALEIYNGTGAAADLSEYVVELYSNGSTSPGNTLVLSDAAPSLVNGDVLVIANSSAAAAILNVADITSTVTFFNGDDALVLKRNGSIIDVIGVVGSDPGSEWGSGDASTGNNTIRRLDTVCIGAPGGFGNPSDISNEWAGFPTDDFSDLGSHIASCGGPINYPVIINCGADLDVTEGVGGNATISASDADGTIAAISISAISPSPSAGSISIGATSGGSATVSVSSDVPAGVYAVTLTATNTDATPQSGSCTLNVNVAFPATGWILNEIHADPASDLTGDANGDGVRSSGDDEFLEIVNTTGATGDISGWTISDGFGLRHVFPSGTVIAPRNAIVIFGGGTPTGAFGDATVQTASTGSLGLNNGGDSITFADDNGLVQAQVSYGSEGGNNQSLTLDPDLTGTSYVRHSTATDSGGALYSPGTFIDGTSFVPSGAEDLFFSEYIEGSSNNKALEIYNGTGGAVNLSEYTVELYSNGSTTTSNTLSLDSAAPTLADGDVLVIANSSAVSAILDVADITSSVTFFNGDDALVLKKNGTIIDIIGVLGSDPGSEWGTGAESTRDNTIRRLPTVCAGDADGFNNPSDISDQWVGFPQNTFDDLGVHVSACGGVINEPVQIDCGDDLALIEGVSGSTTVTAIDPDGVISSVTISNITPALSAGSISISAGPVGAEVTATVSADAAVPSGSYVVEITASNTDAPAQSASCEFTINVVTPVTIAQIQGPGQASPYAGSSTATVGNIVTAIAVDGFYIQTPDANVDADPLTSEGVFVFTGSGAKPAIGDEVSVVGNLIEYFGFTEFSGGVSYTVTASGLPLPTPAPLDETTPAPNIPEPSMEMERYEGMLISLDDGFVSGPTNRFGDVFVTASGERALREPGIISPGLPSLPVWDGNPEMFELNPDGAGLPNLDIASGSTVDAVGVITYSFGDYQLLPIALEVTPPAQFPRPVRDREELEFTVGSLNMLRLFFESPNPDAFADRLNKFSLLIRDVMGSPDILAVQEVGSIEVLEALAAKINGDDSSVNYTSYLIEGNDIGGIDVGFMVRNSIDVLGTTQLLADSTFELPDGRIIPLHDRPPFLIDAVYQAGHLPFPIQVMVVHNRSFNGSEDPEDGEWIRDKRFGQAAEIAQAIQDIQTTQTDTRLVVTGDFNAYQFTDGYVDSVGIIAGDLDPAGALKPGVDLVNPDMNIRTNSLPEEERYSFIFDGNGNALDHMLTSEGLDEYVTGVQYARANADAYNSAYNDPTTPLRASDHDGLVLYVMSERDTDGDGLPDDEDQCPTSDLSATVIIDGCDSGAPNVWFPSGCTISDLIAACAANASNHGDFVSCVSHLANDLKKDGHITGKDKGKITSCAAQANLP